jgi:hypothetical protein
MHDQVVAQNSDAGAELAREGLKGPSAKRILAAYD